MKQKDEEKDKEKEEAQRLVEFLMEIGIDKPGVLSRALNDPRLKRFIPLDAARAALDKAVREFAEATIH